MIKQIYHPLINALNYEKSIINEIDEPIQFNISYLFDFSSAISATLVGGHSEYEVSGELSETLTVTSQFANAFESQLTETISLQSQFINRLESELNATTTLTFGSLKSQLLTTTLNVSSSVEADFVYGMEVTKDISATVSMDKTRVHYVYDGGIVLEL